MGIGSCIKEYPALFLTKEAICPLSDRNRKNNTHDAERAAMLEDNKKLIQRYYSQMWNLWDFSLADEILSETFAFRGSIGIATQGRNGFKEYMKTIRAAFPDFSNTIEDLIAEANKVVAVLTYTGTHHGTIFGVAPTGKRIQYAGTAIFQIEGDQVVSGWVLADRLELLLQLGFIVPSA